MRTLDRVLACAVLTAVASPFAFGADIERGRALYENHCQVCHSSKVHKRERRIALDATELNGIVTRWQQEERLAWTREEIDDVVYYLRRTQYQY